MVFFFYNSEWSIMYRFMDGMTYMGWHIMMAYPIHNGMTKIYLFQFDFDQLYIHHFIRAYFFVKKNIIRIEIVIPRLTIHYSGVKQVFLPGIFNTYLTACAWNVLSVFKVNSRKSNDPTEKIKRKTALVSQNLSFSTSVGWTISNRVW